MPRSDPPPPRASAPKQRVLDLTPTTTISDPSETKEALNEARKRLGASGAPPGSSSPPASQTPTDPPASADTGIDPMKVTVAVLVAILIALAGWIAFHH
jgi:hypothetical protein